MQFSQNIHFFVKRCLTSEELSIFRHTFAKRSFSKDAMKRFFGHQTLNDEDARIGDLQSDDSEGSEDIDRVQQIPSSSPISSIGSIHSSIEASLSSQETTFPAKRLHDTKQIRSKHDSSSHSSSTTSKKWYADSDDEKEDESQSSSSCEPKAAFETSDSNRTMYASRAKKQERKMSNDENITRAAIALRSVTRETKTTAHARRILSKTNDILLQEKETVGDIYDDKSSLQRKDTPAFRKHVDTEIPITKSRDVARHVVDTWQNSNLKSIGKMNSVNSPKAIFGSFRGITSQNKTLGAFAGKSENGVVVEGWLRQKQRRGVKGLKKWNSRYYVVYAETNEIRYYADLVASAWGSIPLNEIGSISARLIQNVEKLSHPKYKGCRFDIKCRNSWGTHYADDYVSHDSSSSLPGIRPYENGDSIGDSTKSSTRVYSLIADSPQTASLWVSMIASLILPSPGSPKGEVRDHISNRVGDKSAPDDTVPWLVKCAVDYIYKSTPGIETPLFYEENADTDKLEVRCIHLSRASS